MGFLVKSFDLFSLDPPGIDIEDVFIPVSPSIENRCKSDCVVLAISLLENLSYQHALVETYGAFTGSGVFIRDIAIVLFRIGYCRFDFGFEISLWALWDVGFFNQSRKYLVCLEKDGDQGREGHSIAFNRLFYGEYLPGDEWHVVTVFSKKR